MDVIGNNIANVNTAGYKTARVIFQDIFSQNVSAGMANNNQPIGQGAIGGTNPTQIGLGIRLSTVDVIHSRAAFQRTDRETDMMINGDGYFIVRGPDGDFYTRAGNFDIDNEGFLVNSLGFFVMGYTNELVMGIVDPGNPAVAGVPGVPAMTARAAIDAGQFAAGTRLSAAIPTGLGQNPFRPGDVIPVGLFQIADEDAVPPLPAIPAEAVTIDTANMQQYNTLAATRDITAAWPAAAIEAYAATPAVPPIPALQARPPVFGLVPADTIPGLSQIQLRAVASDIPFPLPQAILDQVTYELDAEGNWVATVPDDFFDQFAEEEVSLPGFAVADNGDVSVILQNRKVVIGRIAIAMFSNPSGLEKAGNSLYRESASSGPVIVTEAYLDGAGKIDGGGLEMSNVDLADQFTDMIVTQRGFQANSRIITVSDTMLEELVNLKR